MTLVFFGILKHLQLLKCYVKKHHSIQKYVKLLLILKNIWII